MQLSPKIAVVLPAFNEAKVVAKVVNDFQNHLPSAMIVVCDNGSSDGTAEAAKEAGALVIFESRVGKANAVSRLFYEVDADLYIIADADGTYDVSRISESVAEFMERNIDMLIISREAQENSAAFRPMHKFGNWLFTSVFRLIFDSSLTDVLSGYRILSRRFVKSFPITSTGFEVEVEMTALACACDWSVETKSAPYYPRHTATRSKLKTFRDGFKILMKCFVLVLDYRPILFASTIAAAFVLAALGLFAPIGVEFLSTGEVRRLPTAILSLGMVVCGLVSLQAGFILNGITRSRIQAIKLHAHILKPQRF
ncbi:glycosyltransferase family 2 protein [Litoricolaceae bacterium]|nr:glycosyltransferase family 2 protein [Litorivicinaceae bacterium]